MKKWLVSLTAMTTGLCLLSYTVNAETYDTTGKNYNVTFNGNALVSNYSTGAFQEQIQGMQPGDDAIFEISLKNQYDTPVDWYMENNVIKSFEDQTTASDGAYTYKLDYYSPSGVRTELYNSEFVGGDSDDGNVGGQGLHEATTALGEEYLYLDRIATGANSRVVLRVALDGETQINNYQDTEAIVNLIFAVELPKTTPGEPDSVKPSSGTGKRIIYVPNTADPFKALPYFITGLLSLLLFIWSAYLLWRTRDEK